MCTCLSEEVEAQGFSRDYAKSGPVRGGGGAGGQTKTEEDTVAGISMGQRLSMHANLFFLRGSRIPERGNTLRFFNASFWAPQTDAEADGGELTEDGRKRNEKA